MRIAVLYFKPGSIVRPEFYAKETRSWVIFPWETREVLARLFGHTKSEARSIGR
jgi:hypoxanthine phosphoribosyltransferase